MSLTTAIVVILAYPCMNASCCLFSCSFMLYPFYPELFPYDHRVYFLLYTIFTLSRFLYDELGAYYAFFLHLLMSNLNLSFCLASKNLIIYDILISFILPGTASHLPYFH